MDHQYCIYVRTYIIVNMYKHDNTLYRLHVYPNYRIRKLPEFNNVFCHTSV